DELTLALVPEARIVGKVSLLSNDAAQQVSLQLYRRQVNQGRAHWVLAGTAAARSNGEFRFASLPEGTYKLLTEEYMDRDPLSRLPGEQVYGYPPVYYPNASNFAAGNPIHLSAGEVFRADLSLKPQPYHNVMISLANAEPQNLNVRVSREAHPGPAFSLGFKPQDQTIGGSLPDGSYLVEASDSQQTATGAVNIVVRGSPVEQSGLVLQPNQPIRVNVREEFSSQTTSSSHWTVAGAAYQSSRASVVVTLEPTDDFASSSMAMPAFPNPKDPSMVLNNVQPGSYRVNMPPVRGYVASATAGDVDLLHHPLVIMPGAAAPAIEVTLRNDAAEVSGTIDGMTPANDSTTPAASANPFDPLATLRSTIASRMRIYFV